jgi:hypothetical protein
MRSRAAVLIVPTMELLSLGRILLNIHRVVPSVLGVLSIDIETPLPISVDPGPIPSFAFSGKSAWDTWDNQHNVLVVVNWLACPNRAANVLGRRTLLGARRAEMARIIERRECRAAIIRNGWSPFISERGAWDGSIAVDGSGRRLAIQHRFKVQMRIMVKEGVWGQIRATYPRWLAACTRPPKPPESGFQRIVRRLVKQARAEQEEEEIQ